MSTNEFSEAEDLRPVVARLIAEEKDVKFRHLQQNMFVIRRRFGEKAVSWIARVGLVPKRFKDMFPESAEYVLEVDSDQFDSLEEIQQEAVLYHELLHTFLTEKGKFKLVKHDIMEFAAVIEKYGGYLPDVVRTINAVNRHLEKGGSARDTVEELLEDDELELEEA